MPDQDHIPLDYGHPGPRQFALRWPILLAVWAVGLAVWLVYLAVLAYVLLFIL